MKRTSFITPFNTYYYVCMPEGLKNANSTFYRMTQILLQNQIDRNVFSYVDDIVVTSKKQVKHITDLTETFTNMGEDHLKLNPEKCIFGVHKGKVLGCIVSMKDIEANPDKIKASPKLSPSR
jgi:hypothetical protein